jgi:hypothetical protein
MISESPMKVGGERVTLKSSWLIFCSILEASNAPAISDCGAENADLPRILEELDMRLKWPPEKAYTHAP